MGIEKTATHPLSPFRKGKHGKVVSHYSLPTTPKVSVSPDEYLCQRLEQHLPDEPGKTELIALLLPLLAMGARQSAATWQGLREEVAQAVVLALKDDAERNWYVSWDISLERANQIIAVGEARDDLAIQALGTMAKGDALKLVTGRLKEAWGLLDHAGQLYKSSHLPENEREIGWARTRIGRVFICAEVERIDQGFGEAEQARLILEQYQILGRLVMLHLCWARTLDILERQHESLPHYERALEIAKQLGNEGEGYLIRIYNNMAQARRRMGQGDEALSLYTNVLALTEGRAEWSAFALVQQNLAVIYMERGQYGRALRMLQEAEARLEHTYPHAWVSVMRNLLRCYAATRRWQEAARTARRLVAVEGMPVADLLRTYYFWAQVEVAADQREAAAFALQAASKYAEQLKTATWQAKIALEQAHLALRQGLFQEAYSEGVRLEAFWQNRANVPDALSALLLQAEALSGVAQPTTAAQVGERAYRLSRQERALPQQYQAHLLLGDIKQQTHSLHVARRHYQAAMGAVTRIQQGLSYTLTADVLSGYQSAFHRFMAVELASEATASAFRTLEQTKSRLFMGYLHQSHRLRWRHAPETEPWINEVAALRTRHWELNRKSEENGGVPAFTELNQIESRLKSLTDRLYLYSVEDERVAELTPTLTQIQSTLPHNSALLAYYDDGERLYAFLINSDGIRMEPLATTRTVMVELMERIYDNQQMTLQMYLPDDKRGLVQSRKLRREYAELGAILLAPVVAALADLERLYVVPYGVLHGVAFNLLRVNEAYLIEQVEVVTLPCAALITRVSPPAPAGARWVGVSHQGELPHAVDEVVGLQARWGGEVFTESHATQAVLQRGGCQVLHLSTHGVHRVDHHFDLSFLALGDQDLYEDDILQMALSHELVTLSACETAGAKVTPGEELIGLGRAFLYAGAGALVASLWQVRQEVTVRLMGHFYETLFRGASKAAALRQAQLTLLAEQPTLHPVYWGAFQLVGDGAALSQ